MLWQTKGPTCHYLIYNTGQKQALKRVREKQDKHIVISCIYSSSLNHSCIGNLQRGTLLLESSYNFLLLRVCHIPPHKLLLTMTPRSSFLAQLHIVCGTQHILWSDLNLAPTSFVCQPWLFRRMRQWTTSCSLSLPASHCFMDSCFISFTCWRVPADLVAPSLNFFQIYSIFPKPEGIKTANTVTLNGGSDSSLVESSFGAICLTGRRQN